MAQSLRALAAPEDPSSVPRTLSKCLVKLMETPDSADLTPSSGHHRYPCTYAAHTYTHTQF